jgi:hypothetical protein
MTTGDDLDFLDAPLTATDYTEIVIGDLEEAARKLSTSDMRGLIAAVRKKVDQLDEAAEPVEREEANDETDVFTDLGYRRR